MSLVLSVVAAAEGISVETLLARGRTHLFARRLAMHLAAKLTGASLPNISAKIGGCDNTTVLYAREWVSERIEHDQTTKAYVDRLRAEVLRRAAGG